ncbi:MAG: electron transport complex subunit E [Lachnospiraceae bacterium]|nr:electron transport complex subunit E [Lachnospiraceae bacterium]MBP3507245.1 electron transport complex subunit E [Lachnospiraceae bacterium]
MNKAMDRIKNGIITENPTFVQILGMCPTLAVTTSAINGLGMGLSTTVILIMSNLMISALRNVIPNRVRIPAYIVIVASFVTIVDFLLQAFLPELSESLGGYIKLIVVNCIILGRAEAYASKNPVVPSIFDGVGMGLGFTVGLTAIGLVRELIGAGSVFGFAIPGYEPIGIFVKSPGAFIVLAFLIAFLNFRKMKKKKSNTSDTVCRMEDCMHCGNTSCGGKFFDFDGDTDVVGHVGKKEEKKEMEENANE